MANARRACLIKTAAAALLAAIVAVILVATGPRPIYTSDGHTYAILMLMDRGESYEQAKKDATPFFLAIGAGDSPFVKHFQGVPEYWNLFRVRQFDSLLAAPLYPFRGFEALVDISHLGYVLTAVLTVLLVARFASPWVGLVCAILLSLVPPWRVFAAYALTDALAIAMVTLVMYVALLVIEKPRWWLFALFTVLCGAMTFTRPITYIVDAGLLVVTCCAWYGNRYKQQHTDLRPLAGMLAVAIGWTFAVAAVAEASHAPSFWWLVDDTYKHYVARGFAQPGQPLLHWYISSELDIFRLSLERGALALLPFVTITGIVFGRTQPRIQLLAGALVGTWLGAVVDPNRFDTMRCVVLPVAPLALACAAFALVHLSRKSPWASTLLGPCSSQPE